LGYRIWVTIAFRPDIIHYPFDTQGLVLSLEPQTGNPDCIYVPDLKETGISTTIKLYSWNYDLTSWTLDPNNVHYYPPENRTVQRYSFTFTVSRPTRTAWKIFLPPAVILISVFASFVIPIETSAITRLSIVTSALVAEVFFHVGISLPYMNEVVVADYYMFVCYGIIIATIVENIAVMRMVGSKGKQMHQLGLYIELRAKWLVWLIFPTLFGFVFLKVWIACIILFTPSILFIVARIVYQRVITIYYRQKERKKDKDEESRSSENDNEKQTRLPNRDKSGNGVEAQDFRNEILGKEVDGVLRLQPGGSRASIPLITVNKETNGKIDEDETLSDDTEMSDEEH